jgi:hypothetical protein
MAYIQGTTPDHPEEDRLRTRYQILFWVGTFTFLAGILADLNGVRYLNLFVLIGPAAFFGGMALWLFLRIQRPIVSPYNRKKYATQFDAVLAFIFGNFLMEFFGFCVAISMIWVVDNGIRIRNETNFKAGIEILKNNTELKALIGDFMETGIMAWKEKSGHYTIYDFTAYGNKGGTQVSMRLTNDNGKVLIKSYWFGP